MLRTLVRIVIVILCLLVQPSSSHADLFGDVWNGVKGGAQAIGGIVAAPFGGFAKGLTAPSVDHAAAQFREVADHAANRIDAVMESNIARIDKMAETRIAQLDTVMKTRLDQIDSILDKDLNRIDDIITRALDREAAILDTTVTRVDDILEKNLIRLQGIERDAAEHVQMALEDQLPVATSQIARQIEWTAVTLIFFVVVVGYGGVQVLRAYQAARGPVWGRVVTSIRSAWAPAVAVIVPMIVLTAILQTAYIAYYRHADTSRVARLEQAAGVLERAGDFRAAATMRRRAFALDGTDTRRYWMARDLWLADVLQAHRPLEPQELLIRAGGLDKAKASEDAEVVAARLYLRDRLRERGLTTRQEIAAEAASYETRFLPSTIDKESAPILGKLARIVQIRLVLEDSSATVEQRLVNALAKAQSLRTLYESYAQGYLLHSQLASMLTDISAKSLAAAQATKTVQAVPAGFKDVADLETQLKDNVSKAMSLDLGISRLVRITQMRVSDQLADALVKARQPGAPDADKAEASRLLDRFVNETLLPEARLVFRSESLARVRSEEAMWHIVRRQLGERELDATIASAGKVTTSSETNANQLFEAYLTVAERAIAIAEFGIAEHWIDNADKKRVANSVKVDGAIKDRVETVRKALRDANVRGLFLVLS